MKHSITPYLLAGVLLALAGTGTAQSRAQVIELTEYTNDSLGFKIDLPCDPQWQKPTVSGSTAVLVCATTNPIVFINSDHKRISGKKAFEEYVRKQVQVGDIPDAMTRQKLDGHKARRLGFSADGQDVEGWVVAAKGDRPHTFSFVQRAGKLLLVLASLPAQHMNTQPRWVRL